MIDVARRPLNRIFFRMLWTRLFAPMVIISVLLVCIAGYIAGQVFQAQQLSLNRSMSYNVNNYLYNASHILTVLALQQEATEQSEMLLSMDVVIKGYKYFEALYLLDMNGRVAAVSPADSRLNGLDLSYQSFFQQAVQSRETVISRPFISLLSGKPAVYLARAIPGQGVIAGELNLSELEQIVATGYGLSWPSISYIADEHGTLIAHPDKTLVAQQWNVSNMEIVRAARSRESALMYWKDGSLYIGVGAQAGMQRWVVVTEMLAKDFAYPFLGPLLLYLVFSALTLVVFLRLFNIRFESMVSAPLADLSHVTGEIAAGNFEVSQQIDRIPQTFLEISSLTSSFREMIQSILTREERIVRLAKIDPLTGLVNRTVFQQKLQEVLQRSSETQEQFAVMYVDMDGFKTINDAFGHRMGDLTLQHVSNALLANTRTRDVVGRLGGDEFAILLKDLRGPMSACHVAEQILQALNKPIYIEGSEIYISASIGISIFPQDAQSEDSLIRNADTAMYHAKREGKNTYQLYTLEMETQAQERHMLTSLLHHALENNEFELHYQPIVSIHDRRIVSGEALLRWKNPRLGMVAPGKFIPIANETGLILPIGEWVLRTACAQAADWVKQGYPNLVVNVNIAERQLKQQRSFLDLVQRVLDETCLPPHLLKLELTEDIIYQDFREIGQLLAEFKRLGVKLALDDFGTGYTTLSCLTQIPFDEIKLDRSLSSNVTTSSRDAAIVTGIVRICRDLGLQVVAEGIETEEQINFYTRLNCDLLQGFYFSKPVPGAAFEKKLQMCVLD